MAAPRLTLVIARTALHRQRWFACGSAHIYLRMPFPARKDSQIVRFLCQISPAKVLDICRTDNQSNPADRITLIKTSFNALLSIGSSFDVKIQDEVRAVAVSLYSGMCVAPSHFPDILKTRADMLRDETSDFDFVGPTLPVLKSLLTPGSTHKVTEFFQRVVHGLLSSCLLNIDEMRSVHVIFQFVYPILTPRSEDGRAQSRLTKSRTTSWRQFLS
jgi:hypothetical protein